MTLALSLLLSNSLCVCVSVEKAKGNPAIEVEDFIRFKSYRSISIWYCNSVYKRFFLSLSLSLECLHMYNRSQHQWRSYDSLYWSLLGIGICVCLYLSVLYWCDFSQFFSLPRDILCAYCVQINQQKERKSETKRSKASTLDYVYIYTEFLA